MKILKTDKFVFERIKVQPITNAELDVAKVKIEKTNSQIIPISSDDNLYWILWNQDVGINYKYKSNDWYMFQNNEIMLFWNKDSQYYPFFFKKDINAIIKHEVGAGSKEWCVMIPYMIKETLPKKQEQAYDMFVKEFSLSKMIQLDKTQTMYKSYVGVIGHTRVNYNIIQGLDYIYVPNEVVDLVKHCV